MYQYVCMVLLNNPISLIFIAVMTRGEGLSSYYRFQNKFGEYIWMQSRGTMMFDSRTGRPSYIVCMNFVIK